MNKIKKNISLLLTIILCVTPSIVAKANVTVTSPSVILVEASTGQVIYENNATERKSPASITKIMTLLIAFEQIEAGKISLEDQVTTTEHASSMGGSQVFLAEGEIQTLETMIKCIAIASGNDASVAVAEHIAGTEDAFVGMMNNRAAELGMVDTHFEDSCGLSNSDNHYTSAKDVAIMSRELIVKHPEVYNYTMIWMENITHVTNNGSSIFTLSSTNKLLKQYQWATGLKTGSTNKAKYCLSATARKDNIDLIAVVMAAPDYKTRFQDAQTLLNYGFNVSDIYIDENNQQLPDLMVEGGVLDMVPLQFSGEFRYLDIAGNSLEQVEKTIELPESAIAPIVEGAEAGRAKYTLNGAEIGSVPILYSANVEKAVYKDYLLKVFGCFLM